MSNSKDLSALLAIGDDCAALVQAFAERYAGRDIEFDGSVAAANPHADSYDNRHDYLIGPGDKGAKSSEDPSFQFQDVDISDLHLAGSSTPDVLKEETSSTLWRRSTPTTAQRASSG